MRSWYLRAFGLEVMSSFGLPGMGEHASQLPPDIALALVDDAEIQRRWSGPSGPPVWSTTFPDGCPFVLEAGRFGDHLFTYGERARFHLANPVGTLLCAPADAADPAWQRQLLDTVLWCVSSLRGFELLHASAVSRPEGVVAFAAPTGGGKTTLVAGLLRRGNPLFADDIVALGRGGSRIVAHPGPPLMNLPLASGDLGRAIASFPGDDEAWVQLDGTAHEPGALAAVFLLDRRFGADTSVDRLSESPLHLMPHSVGFRHRKARCRARFELFADLVSTTPVYRLRADVGVPADELATVVEECAAAGRGLQMEMA